MGKGAASQKIKFRRKGTLNDIGEVGGEPHGDPTSAFEVRTKIAAMYKDNKYICVRISHYSKSISTLPHIRVKMSSYYVSLTKAPCLTVAKACDVANV